ncbi:MAG: hypothetical protein K6E31_06820 [bacterium]|nr:hypothetical protein [bacterium]
MNSKRQFLESEIVEIKRILASIPEEDVVDRATFEFRLRNVEAQLRELPDTPEPETMTITFKGDPVRGTHGIYADFASKTISFLSDAFDALVAMAEGTPPAQGDVFPETGKHRLLITGTALGSFGFELELPEAENASTQQLFLSPEAANPFSSARAMLETLLARALEADDEHLADAVENAGARALDNVRKFYEILRDNNATFSLKTGARRIEYPDVERVNHAAERLKSDNIIESKQSFIGKITGVLPLKRDFEFLTEENRRFHGKIDPEFENIGALHADWSGKKVKITLNVRTVGKAHPRYTLLGRNDIAAVVTVK